MMSPTHYAPRSRSSLRRARARRRSAGAAMFIVAITLGLLAAMGVYGLTATAYDVRAAGHGRAAAQAQHAAELAMVTSATLLRPENVGGLAGILTRGNFPAKPCKSAKPVFAGDQIQNAAAETCIPLSPDSNMRALAPVPGSWPTPSGGVTVPFTAQSFGEVPWHPFINVELTNPVTYPAPSGGGYAISQGGGVQPPVFTSIRVTVYVEMRPDIGTRADSVVTGRGRLVVGPYTPTSAN